jgi:hypothetical protein
MPRTVVPRQPARAPGPQPSARETAQEPSVVGDSLPEKLVKYVPAETLAFFVPLAAAIGTENRAVLIAVVVIAAVGTVGYLWWAARALPPEQRPLVHFYVLAVIAFACWAIATAPNLAQLLGIDTLIAGVILACAVFLIPLADNILSALIQGHA